MTVDLTGKTALVTGASRGIGRAVAEQLAEAGATVALHHSGRQSIAALAARLGGHAVAADLADPREAKRLWDDAMETLGRVDIVVANAGVFVEADPEGDLDDWLAAWDRTLAVNLTSLAVLSREAVNHWAERHADEARQSGEVVGRLVTVSSRAAFRGDDPAFLAYAASKGGVVALTKSIARGWGRRGVAAFGVAPGFTRTDMAADALATDAAGLEAQTSLGAIAEPGEVAPTVVFLASGLADHATGTTVDVNGASYVR